MAKKKLDDLAVSAFCESMGMMLQAGINVDEAIGLFHMSEKNGELASVLKTMRDSVENSVSLSDAMRQSGVFDSYVCEMVESGQNTGRLEQTMFHLSDYYKNQRTIRDNLRSALLYPCGMLLMIVAVLVVMLKMVLPVFAEVYASLSGSMQSGAFPYLQFSAVLCRVLLILALIVIVLIVCGLLLWNSSKRAFVEKIISVFPSVKNILETLGLLRFTSAFDMYLSSGSMQEEALENAARVAQQESVEKKLEACRKSMEEGHSFANAAYECELYEPVYGRMLLPAEKSGSLEDALRTMIRLLREDSAEQISRLINILEPLLSGILMLSVAVMLLSLMLPLIGIMNSIR